MFSCFGKRKIYQVLNAFGVKWIYTGRKSGREGEKRRRKETQQEDGGSGQRVELDQQGLVSLQLSHLSNGHDAAYLQVWVSWELNEKMHSDRYHVDTLPAILPSHPLSPETLPSCDAWFLCSCPPSPGSPSPASGLKAETEWTGWVVPHPPPRLFLLLFFMHKPLQKA